VNCYEKKNCFILIAIVAVATATAILVRRSQVTKDKAKETATHQMHDGAARRVELNNQIPAHYESVPSPNELRATLSPEHFTGKAREAYQVVREIPQLIAQMPCYCHCDRSLGHKSLHSCFEDDHAANCATCIQEALTASALQKQGLSAEKIRERIIAEFSAAE
jgi:hypothetical protein